MKILGKVFLSKQSNQKEQKDKKQAKRQGFNVEKLVFSPDFIVDSVRIKKKDILSYVKGKCIPLFGDDFYYAYVYEKGVLKFIALKTSEYVKGNLPLFFIGFLRQGKFYYYSRETRICYVIENSADRIAVYVDASIPSDALNFEELVQNFKEGRELNIKDIPDTLFLRWSLEQESSLLLKVSLILLVFSFLFFMGMFVKQRMVVANMQKLAKEKVIREGGKVEGHNVVQRHGNEKSFIFTVGDIASFVSGKGYIESIRYEKGELVFTLKFESEVFLNEFLAKYGGRYEDGKVVYTTRVSNN